MKDFVHEQARRWTYRRQCLGQSAHDALSVLRAVVGVYSAHPSGPLSLHARTRAFTKRDFDALETERRALRLPAMRLSIHLLPRDSAHLTFAATRTTLPEYRYLILRGLITERGYDHLEETLLRALREPMTAQRIRAVIDVQGLPLSGVLKTMCRKGMLLRIAPTALRSNALRYVATDAWLGSDLPAIDTDEALQWLADAYVRSFGPVRPTDFVWWSGVARTRAITALTTVDTADVGSGYLLHTNDVDAYRAAAPIPMGNVDLLPKWDCYTMGYPPDGRERFASTAMQKNMYDAVGNSLGTVLVEGEACGAWDVTFTGSQAVVHVDCAARMPPAIHDAIHDRARAVATFLGASTVVIGER